MKTQNRICFLPVILLAALVAGCATRGKPPPVISLDEPRQERAAQLLWPCPGS
jgi:type IV secretion system protein VirB9